MVRFLDSLEEFLLNRDFKEHLHFNCTAEVESFDLAAEQVLDLRTVISTLKWHNDHSKGGICERFKQIFVFEAAWLFWAHPESQVCRPVTTSPQQQFLPCRNQGDAPPPGSKHELLALLPLRAMCAPDPNKLAPYYNMWTRESMHAISELGETFFQERLLTLHPQMPQTTPEEISTRCAAAGLVAASAMSLYIAHVQCASADMMMLSELDTCRCDSCVSGVYERNRHAVGSFTLALAHRYHASVGRHQTPLCSGCDSDDCKTWT